MKTQRDVIWKTFGTLQGKIDTIEHLLSQGRIREAKKAVSEAQAVSTWFDTLPIHAPAPQSTAGLPSGDKD